MASKLNVNVLNMQKEFSLKSTNTAKIDYQGFFRGILEEVNLIEVDYTEDIAVNFNKDRTEDHGKKIQLEFKFNLFTDDANKPLVKTIRTGTTFSKQIINQKYKSRGNKVMKSVFNKFTDVCLALGFIQPYQLHENDSLVLDKIEKTIKEYNSRSHNDKVLIAGCFVQGEEKLIIDWFNMVYVDKIDYENDDILTRIESLKTQKNQNLPTKATTSKKTDNTDNTSNKETSVTAAKNTTKTKT